MSNNVDDLILDLLEWLGSNPRPYAEVMDAWRTSCPKLPVWEEANDRGYVERSLVEGAGLVVGVTEKGAEQLTTARRPARVS
jgi:D-3-phosphoglycerate dehydrogenase / 2-oxoglutarate reductase